MISSYFVSHRFSTLHRSYLSFVAPSLQFHFCTSLHCLLSLHSHLRTLRTSKQSIGQPFGWVYSVRVVILLPCAEFDPYQVLVHGVALRHPPSAPKQDSFRNTVRFSDTCRKHNNDTFSDLSALVLPTSAPNFNSPPVWFTISIIISISLGFLFLVSVSLLSLYCKSDKAKAFIEKPLVIHLILFLGIISTVFGMFPPRLLVNYIYSLCRYHGLPVATPVVRQRWTDL